MDTLEHRLMMRLSVMAADLLILLPAFFMFSASPLTLVTLLTYPGWLGPRWTGAVVLALNYKQPGDMEQLVYEEYDTEEHEVLAIVLENESVTMTRECPCS